MKKFKVLKNMVAAGILLGVVNSFGAAAEHKDEFVRYDGAVIGNVHVVVKNIAKLGLCGDYAECFRAYVYVNGNEYGGDHIGTFVASPGREGDHQDWDPAREEYVTTHGIDTEEGDYDLEVNGQTPLGGAAEADRNGLRFQNYSMFELYKSSASFGAKMPFAMFYNKGQALHCSYGKVDGERHSHGCVRLRCGEAEKLFNLVKRAEGRLTVSIRDTEETVSVLTEAEKLRAAAREILGTTEADVKWDSLGSGALY